jgi:hypothetical protein
MRTTGGLGRKKIVTVPTTLLQLVLFVCIVTGQAVVMGVSCSRSCAQEELQQQLSLQSLQSSKSGLIFSNASRSMYAANCILSFRCRDNYCKPPMSKRFMLDRIHIELEYADRSASEIISDLPKPGEECRISFEKYRECDYATTTAHSVMSHIWSNLNIRLWKYFFMVLRFLCGSRATSCSCAKGLRKKILLHQPF